MWSEGDTVLWRSVAFGHVRFAMPHRLVALSPEEVVLWVPPGTQGKRFAGRPLSEIELVRPDGAWTWKDEDHLASAVGYGHVEPDVAAATRAEGVRVVPEWPFPTGWEDSRPDAGWPIPTLPDGWDGV